MTWFLCAVAATLLWALVNHADKYLLSSHGNGGHEGIGALMLFSTGIAALVLPILYLIRPDVILVDMADALMLILVGLITAASIYVYLTALNEEDTSVVVIFFQLIPVIGYFLGWLILGETLTMGQIVASLIILAGTTIVAFEYEHDEGFSFKWKVVILMSLFALMTALSEVVFKDVALTQEFIPSLFWNHVGLLCFGVGLSVFVPAYRHQFSSMLRSNPIKIFSINMGSEVITIAGNVCFLYAMTLAPVALVMLVGSFQSIFAFLLAVVFVVFFPRLGVKEKLTREHIVLKLGSILMVGAGSILLFFVS
ncbi:MAG: DMT family transporter [Candidatus Pacebacteria bacterium]|nr:DMT family transporter [Candidatus Paceibacterota bacterium]